MNMTQQRPDPAFTPLPAAHGSGSTPACTPAGSTVVDSQAVLRGHQAITIAHNGSYYRLQTTRQGKLILTK